MQKDYKYINTLDEKELRAALIEAKEALTEETLGTEVLVALADAYNSMYFFDLKENTYRELNSFDTLGEFYSDKENIKDNQVLIQEAMKSMVTAPFLKDVLAFTDFSTLPNRMRGKKIISVEFIAKVIGWARANFVTVRSDEEGMPISVLYAIRIVEEEKRKEETLERIARTDGLTGLYNRYAYENDIKSIVQDKMKDFVYVAMDLNGLKGINDSLGHSAGDEYIMQASKYISNAFKEVGDTYRIGGDEFIALVWCGRDELDRIIKDFDNTINNTWKKSKQGISLSRGIVSHEEFPLYSVEELEKKADERMYMDKYQYYITHPSSSLRKDKALIEEILRALSSNFDSIFLVDTANKRINVYRKNVDLPKEFWDYVDTNPDYEELLARYVQSQVVEEDRNKIMELASLASLKEIIKKQTAYSLDYRVQTKDSPIWYRMKFAKLESENEFPLFALGLENISNEKRDDAVYFKIGKKILIIDSDETARKELSTILGESYGILEAENTDEGMRLLDAEYEDVAVIVADVDDADINGFQFINRVSSTPRYGAIPIIAAAEHNRKASELRALELGASDFMNKPYNADVVRHYVKSLTRLRSSIAMLNTLEKDPLTGIYTKDFFIRKAEEILAANPDEDFRIVVSDVQKFKLINEKYGIETGDNVLRYIATASQKYFPKILLCGRLSGDKFVFLQENFSQTREEGMKLLHNLIKHAPVPNLVLKQGIYYTSMDRNMTIQAMCDRARLACESVKEIYGQYCAVYDDKLRKDLLVRQQVLENMEEALKNEQFQIYLQPKHDLSTDKTGGAEALVRWIHPELGFMNPSVFIPLFEQNGFVKELDRYVLTMVCKTLNRWIKEGKQVVPLSVNLSRRDFEDKNLAGSISELVDSYGIPHELIHLELTESAFSDNPEMIAGTIKILHSNGFVIELDDFGTGYSSLMTLSNIECDILKLDMSIIQNEQPETEKNVLEFCAQLIKMMKLQSVAEGVETERQKERMKELGCDYIQGFYYSKPLPIPEFEQYLVKEYLS